MHQAETIGGDGSQQEDWEVQGALLHAQDQLLGEQRKEFHRGGGQVSNLTMGPGDFESKCLLFKSRYKKGYTSFQS